MNTRIISALIAPVAIPVIASIASAQTPAPQPSTPPTSVTSPAGSAPATTAASPDAAEMLKQTTQLAKTNANHNLLADPAASCCTAVNMMPHGKKHSVT